MLVPGPLHPYGIQRLIKHWGKDQVVNVGQRANLYKTIKRLHEAGLIAVRQTERDHQYPERTVYELTAAGTEQAQSWLVDMLSAPRHEVPEFPAALSFLMMLEPGRAATVLQDRAGALRRQVAELDAVLTQESAALPRVTLLETEYLKAVSAAELGWVESVVDDLRSGTLGWTYEELAAAVVDDPSGTDDRAPA